MALSILQSNPKANYLAYKPEIDEAISRTLDHGWYILGREVIAFEQEFADYIGVFHGIGVGSGTDAIHLSLRACGVGSGDAVLTVSHTAVATVAAIEMCGAVPIFVDIDPKSFTMDPNCLESTIKQYQAKTIKAVIPVHLYGHPADLKAITEIARRHNLRIIEDCAQSHGAECEGRKTGAWGDIAAFSFYPTKNLSALGDGGIVATSNYELAEKVRSLREYGWKDRYVSQVAGWNSRLDELQAAILRVKLAHLNEGNQKRKNLAQLYQVLLKQTELQLPETNDNVSHVFHQYVVRSPRRDLLKAYLHNEGIGTLIHYPMPVHLQPAYLGKFAGSQNLQHSEMAVQEILSLPMYPELSTEQVNEVGHKIHTWTRG